MISFSVHFDFLFSTPCKFCHLWCHLLISLPWSMLTQYFKLGHDCTSYFCSCFCWLVRNYCRTTIVLFHKVFFFPEKLLFFRFASLPLGCQCEVGLITHSTHLTTDLTPFPCDLRYFCKILYTYLILFLLFVMNLPCRDSQHYKCNIFFYFCCIGHSKGCAIV
jgi:hypothetical protein